MKAGRKGVKVHKIIKCRRKELTDLLVIDILKSGNNDFEEKMSIFVE